jgi:hypothetical protein
MRLVLLFAVSAALGMAAGNNTDPARAEPTELTIVLDFEGPHSDESLAEMKRETASIMKAAGFAFDWRLRSEVGHKSYPNLISVKLKGECLVNPARPSHSVRGPLALSHTTRTAVMRFADIHCDAVSSLVRSGARVGKFEHGNLLFGRAMGRVLAHELWHILGNTFAHGENGIAQRAFSAEQLISERLDLDTADIERFRFWRAKREHGRDEKL